MNHLSPLLLGMLALGCAQAAEFTTVLPERSSIAFTSRQMGVPVEGRFKRFTASLAFDPARPEAGRTSVEIDLASIDAGSTEANDEVAGKPWFNLKSFPTARFQSSGVKALGGGRFEVRGQMNIKGRSREVVVPFSFREEGKQGVFEGSFPLNRLDYALGEGPWADTGTVAGEVLINVRLLAAPAKP
ncbi:MAG: YceI family protein [Rhodocyclaceae bacterium]|jgi:polyisoprenoid-binding protein YceI|nr:YceI family protein [Rhodocyclaceae bacterium]